MVSIALVDARKTSLTGVQNIKKIGSPLRGSWTMVSIALVDARKTSLTGVQNSKKNRLAASRLVDDGLHCVSRCQENIDHLWGFKISKKIGSPLRGSWTMLRIVVGSNPPLGKKLDPPLVIPLLLSICNVTFFVFMSEPQPYPMWFSLYYITKVKCIFMEIFFPQCIHSQQTTVYLSSRLFQINTYIMS